MLQASLFDGFAFDLFPFQQDGLTTPEVHIGGREVLQAFVVSAVIVVADEGLDLCLEVAGWTQTIVRARMDSAEDRVHCSMHAGRGDGIATDAPKLAVTRCETARYWVSRATMVAVL